MGVDDGDEDRECGRCHETMHIPPGAEPSEFCHDCAHSLVDELRARVAELEAGHARYEWLRCQGPRYVLELWNEALRAGNRLDDMIDAKRCAGNKPASLPEGT